MPCKDGFGDINGLKGSGPIDLEGFKAGLGGGGGLGGFSLNLHTSKHESPYMGII